MTDQLQILDVTVCYGDFEAVRGVSLSLGKGDIGCLLGPSGCGKTTLLRAIAGFEKIQSGEIKLGQRIISDPDNTTPPEQRRVGMVFQDFALFPHLTIAANVGFGLAAMSSSERNTRVATLLDMVGLGEYLNAYPHQLSGGQQQRVALARAIAPSPDILLLDEPFSNLDSELREQLAAEVRQLLKSQGITAILVTHDQQEAFAMADSIALLQSGRLVQLGTAQDLYQQPSNEFVAGFIGQGAVIEVDVGMGHILGLGLGPLPEKEKNPPVGTRCRVLVRPEAIVHDASSGLQLEVTSRSFRGAHIAYTLALVDGQRLEYLAPATIDIAPGARMPVRFDLRNTVLMPVQDTA